MIFLLTLCLTAIAQEEAPISEPVTVTEPITVAPTTSACEEPPWQADFALQLAILCVGGASGAGALGVARRRVGMPASRLDDPRFGELLEATERSSAILQSQIADAASAQEHLAETLDRFRIETARLAMASEQLAENVDDLASILKEPLQ
jgi:hypothetical protein